MSDQQYLIDTRDPSALVSSYQERRRDLIEWMHNQVQVLPEELEADDMATRFKQLQISGNLHEDVHLGTRFLMGEIARRVKANTDYGEICDTLEHVAEKFKLGNVRTLRQCIRTAETFHGNAKLFGRWLMAGEKKRWRDFVLAGQAEVDPTALGEEAFTRWVEGEMDSVQHAAERAEQAAAEIDPDDEETIREMEGVVTMLTQRANELRRTAKRAWEDEGATDRVLELYIDWLHEMPCLACGEVGDTEAHHVEPSVTAKKQSHFFRCPLCHDCHMTLEDHTHAHFKEKTGHDIRELTARTLHLFIAGSDARFPPGLC